MNRQAFLGGAATSAAPLVVRRRVTDARAQATATAVPEGFIRLRVVEDGLAVGGKTGRVYRIQQDAGTLGYTGAKGGGFRVALENATKDPTSIHWHGLILLDGRTACHT